MKLKDINRAHELAQQFETLSRALANVRSRNYDLDEDKRILLVAGFDVKLDRSQAEAILNTLFTQVKEEIESLGVKL